MISSSDNIIVTLLESVKVPDAVVVTLRTWVATWWSLTYIAEKACPACPFPSTPIIIHSGDQWVPHCSLPDHSAQASKSFNLNSLFFYYFFLCERRAEQALHH
jgi:hypothetical protein